MYKIMWLLIKRISGVRMKGIVGRDMYKNCPLSDSYEDGDHARNLMEIALQQLLPRGSNLFTILLTPDCGIAISTGNAHLAALIYRL